MTRNEASLMKQLMSYAHHCYDNKIAIHESFPLLACTKEDFNDFKEADPSKATAPDKVKRRLLQPIFPSKKDRSFKTSKEPS